MAYQHDPDGPYADKGAFRAKSIAYGVCLIVISIISFIVIKSSFGKKDFMEIAEIEVKATLLQSTTNFTISHTENSLSVKMWYADLAAGSKKAYEGDEQLLKEWNNLKVSTRDLSEVITNILHQYVSEADSFLMIVNENNHARNLLVYKNGSLVYDVVQDTKGETDG